MSKRYDVCSPRAGREEGKTFWHRVGTAFDGEKGISVKLDSLPLPDAKGEVWLKLFEPREKSQGAERGERSVAANPARTSPAHPSQGSRVTLDDEVPFEMEWRG